MGYVKLIASQTLTEWNESKELKQST